MSYILLEQDNVQNKKKKILDKIEQLYDQKIEFIDSV